MRRSIICTLEIPRSWGVEGFLAAATAHYKECKTEKDHSDDKNDCGVASVMMGCRSEVEAPVRLLVSL